MIIGMVLETLGVGLVIPVIALITDENLAKSYPRLQPALEFLGNPDQKTIIVGAMLSLVGIYLIKSVFLGFLVWRQSRFAFGIQHLTAIIHYLPSPAIHVSLAAQFCDTDSKHHTGSQPIHLRSDSAWYGTDYRITCGCRPRVTSTDC